MTTGSLELRGRRSQLLTTRLTKRVYDLTAPFYPLSTLVFHSRAHRRLMALAGPIEGQKVLEVAIGSGELFEALLRKNRGGLTAGVDLSPGMVSVVRKRVEGNNGRPSLNGNDHSRGRFFLQAVDARQMPFSDGMFDSLFNCYLFELLPPADIERVVREFHRVLRPGGKLHLVSIGVNSWAFNFIYGWLGYAVPSFWGRQVAREIPRIIEQGGFRVRHSEVVSQTMYPSLITIAER